MATVDSKGLPHDAPSVTLTIRLLMAGKVRKKLNAILKLLIVSKWWPRYRILSFVPYICTVSKDVVFTHACCLLGWCLVDSTDYLKFS